MPYRPGSAGWIRCARASTSSSWRACRSGGAGQRGGRVGVEVGAGMQAEQPERPGGVGVQVPVGPGEHRPHRGARVPAGLQQVQPLLLVGQLAGQVGQRHGRAGGGQLGGHPQRQRQPAALGGQLRGRVRFGVHPCADQRPQQADRVRRRQQVQVQAGGAVPGHQPGQRIAAGHHHRAGRAAGQQRPDLLRRSGVVQHDQHPPAGQQAAVPGGALVLSRPGCPGRARPGRAGTRPARRRRASAGRGHSRAGSRTAARRGTAPATWCAQCTASAVLPTPAVPPIALITTVPGIRSPDSSSSAVRVSQFMRPAGEMPHRGRQFPRHGRHARRRPPRQCQGSVRPGRGRR